MSELINGEIVLKNFRRNYYTAPLIPPAPDGMNSLNESRTFIVNIDETTPAGIPPTSIGESAVTFINPETGGDMSEVIYEINAPKAPSNISNEVSVPDENSVLPASYVRFYNMVPNGNEISIFINDEKVFGNIMAGKGTDYYKLHPGIYSIKFATSDNDPFYEYKFKALSGMNSTLALSGSENVYTVSDISGAAPTCFFNTAYVRFVQLSMTAPAMDIFIDGIPVISGILFGEVSAFIGVPNGVHNIKAVASGTGIVYINEKFKFPSDSVNDMLISGSENYTMSIITEINSCS